MKCIYSYVKIKLIQVELRPFFSDFNSKQNPSNLRQALLTSDREGKLLYMIPFHGIIFNIFHKH